MDYAWWEDCVVYQIYPRSFQDSNNDGIGDIQGIIQRLDYLQSLQIDAIWLSPIFLSPMADFGYDVSSYREIDPIFGTLADVDELLHEAHQRNVKVLLDLVLNHTSNMHPWFLESRESKENEKADFYIWSDTIPNNWYAAFGGKAWTYDASRKQYYLHSFLAEQPDLNWRNPKVVDAVLAEIRFWLEKGVDGFRLDVINCIVKDESLRNNPRIIGSRPRPYDMQRHIFDRNRTETHQKLKMIRKLMDEYGQRMLVGEIMVEMPGEPELAASFLGRYHDELHLSFDFSLAATPFKAQRWKTVAKRWYEAVGRHRVPTWVLNNHDLSRFYSREGESEAKAKLAALFLCTQRGALFLYYGEELGLPNSKISRLQLRDPLGKKYWPFHPGRDPERGPMVWSTGEGNGFSTVEPWLPFAKASNRYSVENQEMEESSMLLYYRNLLELRKDDETLRRGLTSFVETTNVHVLAYCREHQGQQRLILLNFSKRRQTVDLPSFALKNLSCELVFSTHASPSGAPVMQFENLLLQPYQGLIVRLPEERQEQN
nr:alpha-amylase family glycosyl hydrolase [uncultured Sphaerochaeta sp.]